MAITRCPSCSRDVPDANFCVHCGHQLSEELERPPLGVSRIFGGGVSGVGPTSLSAVRRRFAAAPDERVLQPSVVSTIFPQLPGPSLRAFRVALAAGLGAVLVLGLLKLYPVGLIAAAVLVPLLTAVYFFDVDVYEDQPLTVIGFTLLCGAVLGVAFALLTNAVSPSGAGLFVEGGGERTLVRGVLLPLLSVALMLAGPLVLLPRPRFNDVLDGATFGAGSAAAFTGAEVLVHGIDTLRAGLRPPGEVAPWLVRLSEIAIALPVLSMSVIGAASAALWLRYRAPVRDRRALGPWGLPAVAVPLAAAMIVAGALVQLELPSGAALAVLAVLDVCGLIWLRRVVQVGLVEEALEIESAEQITCANCGHPTRRGNFCEHCGIAQLALPKERVAGGPVEPVEPVGF